MGSIDKDALVAKLKEIVDYEGIKNEVDDLKGVSIFHWPGEIFDIIEKVIIAVEKIFSELQGMDGPAGKEKRDIVVGFLDGIIKLPFYAEMIDGPVIGMVVDYIVNKLNKALGHTWGEAATAPLNFKINA